jgi:hypothetical protein
MTDDLICKDHSGCMADIQNLKDTQHDQWENINQIKNRINVILGGVCASCILLVVDMILRKV